MRIHPYGPFFPMAQGVRQQFVPPDAFADQFRAAISSNVREYRSHRALLDLPRLKYALGFDGYHVDLDGFILSIYPNLVERPTIGGGSRFEVYFDVTVEVVTPATRDHPAEADERTVCTGDHILDALAAARTILRIEQVREKIREDAMCRMMTEKGGWA